MALETKDINNAADMRRYVEGCLNDLMEGLSTKDETMKYLHDYTLRVIDITAERVGQNASTSDEALPIADVVCWADMTEETPNLGDLILVRFPPEQRTRPIIIEFDELFEWIDGTQYIRL